MEHIGAVLPRVMARLEKAEWGLSMATFEELIGKAAGNRSYCRYSRDAGLSSNYLATMLCYMKAPRRETVEKLAAASEGRVTAAEFETALRKRRH